MNNEEIVAYLLVENRKAVLNLSGIEKVYGIGAGRIKNVLFAKDVATVFRPDEIISLSKFISDLQV